MEIILIIILIAIVAIIINKCRKNSLVNSEQFGVGALTQLYAKGPEDVYLTSGIEQYIYPYMSPFFWNQPTRFSRNVPYYLYLDDYVRSYPFYYPYVRYY